MTEICSELGYGVVDGVGGHTRCLRDGICQELQGGDIPSESEKVVEKGVPLQYPCHGLHTSLPPSFHDFHMLPRYLLMLFLFHIAGAPLGAQACTFDIALFHCTCLVLPSHKPWLVVQGQPGSFYIDHSHPFGAPSTSSNAGMIANAAVDIWEAEGICPICRGVATISINESWALLCRALCIIPRRSKMGYHSAFWAGIDMTMR